ncbi:MAG: TonB-dependent receptor [Mangrovibacterium sp.]|nr:TonB-dependent receptor [Mangrovibacterium sp.]
MRQRTVNTNYDNPWFAAYELVNKFNRIREIGSVQLDYQVFQDLKIKGRYSYNGSNEKSSYQQPWSSYSGDGGGSNTAKGYYSETITNLREMNADLLISWEKQIGKFDIRPSFGGNYMTQRNYNMNAGGKNLVIPGLYTLSNVEREGLSYSSLSYKKNIYSVYALANLSYGNMIYLDVTARNDWSSTLPEANRSYFYPSASLSVLLNEMFTVPEWISLFKFRTGWAQVGKDTDPYEIATVLKQGAWGDKFTYSLPSNLTNVNLKPEIATSFEVGTDISLFNNRLGAGFTYYSVENKNQILNASTSAFSGYTAAIINAGLVQNRGIEIELTMSPVKMHHWNWDMNVNFTRERSKLKELTTGIDQYQFWQSTQVYCITQLGDDIGDIYARDCVRVAEGEYKGWPLLDSNGRLQRNNAEYQKVGNFTHDFMMGFQSSLRYKNLMLSLSLDWRQGGKYYDQTMMRLTRAGKVEKFRPDSNSSTFTGILSNHTFQGNTDELIREIKNNPEVYQNNVWVGGRTEELGGFLYGGVHDGSFYPGVISDGKGGYKENFGAEGTKYIHAYQVYETSGGFWDRASSNKWFYDASFIKLREIVLSYSLPKSLACKFLAQDITVSAFMKNIILWSAAKTNMDPESTYKQYGNGTLWQGASTWNGSPIIMPAGFKLSVNF